MSRGEYNAKSVLGPKKATKNYFLFKILKNPIKQKRGFYTGYSRSLLPKNMNMYWMSVTSEAIAATT